MQPTSSRRSLLQTAFVWLALITPALAVVWDVLNYIVPRRKRTNLRKVFVAQTEQLPSEEVLEMVDLLGRPVAVMRQSQGAPLALSLVCTHLGCRVHWQPKQKTFLCPCHMGVFDSEGRVMSGPPPSPLPRYSVNVEGENVFILFPEV
jgi:cytochrome b6-f complex iron-sulfur subunit